MKSGTCPKCQSTEILCAPRGAWHGMHQIHINWADTALVECLICSRCGFVEPYVDPGLSLRKMRRAFERYEPPASRARKADEGKGEGA